MTTSADLTEQVMRNLWPAFKRRLLAKCPGEDWIRSMYLLRAMRASSSQVHILAAVPPNGRIIAGALNRLAFMRELLKPNFNLSLTVYPDAYQVSEARRRYNVDMAPKTRSKVYLYTESI
jgi:hypothetical protein